MPMLVIVLFSLISNIDSARAFSADKLPSELHGIEEGDLIFYQGSSHQYSAIFEASESAWSHVGIIFKDVAGNWVVWEAIQPVGINPLSEFVARARTTASRKLLAVYRVDLNHIKWTRHQYSRCLSTIKEAMRPYLGIDYNHLFRWSFSGRPQQLYCSQFTYLAFQACGLAIGKTQRTVDLNIGDAALQLFEQRYPAVREDVDRLVGKIRERDRQQKERLAHLRKAFRLRYANELIVTPASVIRDSELKCVVGCDLAR